MPNASNTLSTALAKPCAVTACNTLRPMSLCPFCHLSWFHVNQTMNQMKLKTK